MLHPSILAAALFSVFVAATSPPTVVQTTFEGVCVGSLLSLNPEAMGKLAETAAKTYGMKFKEVPRDMLTLGSPFAKVGWVIFDDKIKLIVAYGERRDSDFLSRSCSITGIGVLSFDDAKKIVESYPVKKDDDFQQGLSHIVLYEAELAGFGSRRLAMSIQFQSQPERMFVISLFEVG